MVTNKRETRKNKRQLVASNMLSMHQRRRASQSFTKTLIATDSLHSVLCRFVGRVTKPQNRSDEG